MTPEIEQLKTLITEQGKSTQLAMLEQSKAVMELANKIGILTERIIHVMEKHVHIERDVSMLKQGYSDLKNTVGLNKFANQMAPRVMYAILGAFIFGVSSCFAALKIIYG